MRGLRKPLDPGEHPICHGAILCVPDLLTATCPLLSPSQAHIPKPSPLLSHHCFPLYY